MAQALASAKNPTRLHARELPKKLVVGTMLAATLVGPQHAQE
jgi:hypothetical protein